MTQYGSEQVVPAVVTLDHLRVSAVPQYCKLWESRSLAAVSRALKSHQESHQESFVSLQHSGQVNSSQGHIQQQHNQQQHRHQHDQRPGAHSEQVVLDIKAHDRESGGGVGGRQTHQHCPQEARPEPTAANPIHTHDSATVQPGAASCKTALFGRQQDGSMLQRLQLPWPVAAAGVSMQPSTEAAVHAQLLHDAAMAQPQSNMQCQQQPYGGLHPAQQEGLQPQAAMGLETAFRQHLATLTASEGAMTVQPAIARLFMASAADAAAASTMACS